jgi:hypothetical protein
MKIIDYYTLFHFEIHKLDELINDMLKLKVGWQPYGFTYVKDQKFYQPMVKYDDK